MRSSVSLSYITAMRQRYGILMIYEELELYGILSFHGGLITMTTNANFSNYVY